MKTQTELDVLVSEYWQFTKEHCNELKEHVERLEDFIEGKEDEEGLIQIIYEDIVVPIEGMKEYLHKIFVLKLMEKKQTTENGRKNEKR